MASLKLTAVKAKHGDAILLEAMGATVLIDGGPPGVFNRFLKNHLEDLEDDGEDPPVIDLMMVSHVDSDHIAGLLDLTSDLIETEEENGRPMVTIHQAWLNSFADTIAQAGLDTPRGARVSASSLASVYEDEASVFPGEVDESTTLVLSSVSQGRNLRRDLKTLSIGINGRFRNRLALRDNNPDPWTRGALKITVIGPTQTEINRLKEEWAKQLPKILKKEEEKAARTQAAQSLDTSVFNLASIVVIAEADGKRILLTGDARGDMILDWLEAAEGDQWPKHFDVVKLPHHGSDRNVDLEFFQKVTADSYVVCGDGKHGNPEPRTFGWLQQARPDADYLIYMTYGPEELKTHHEFIEDGKVPELNLFQAEHPDWVDRLRFPGNGETSITILV